MLLWTTLAGRSWSMLLWTTLADRSSMLLWQVFVRSCESHLDALALGPMRAIGLPVGTAQLDLT